MNCNHNYIKATGEYMHGYTCSLCEKDIDAETYDELTQLRAENKRLTGEVERLRAKSEDHRNMLEDVVNELDLSEDMIEQHGPLGTAPATLVHLVLERKDREISMLKMGMIPMGATALPVSSALLQPRTYEQGAEEMRERIAKRYDQRAELLEAQQGGDAGSRFGIQQEAAAARKEAATIRALPIPAQQESVCEWTQPSTVGYDWREVGCNGKYFELRGDDMRFCPYCGKPICVKGGGE